jgi:hypothetical protein
VARYVLVAFDSDAEADAFANAMTIEGGVFYMGQDTHFKNVNPVTAFVRGLWQKPTKYCSCTSADMKGRKETYTRGKKYGWWVHNICGKPTAQWSRGDHFFQSLGVNLLPVTKNAPEWRGKGVYGHNYDEARKVWVHAETGEDYDIEKARKERKKFTDF